MNVRNSPRFTRESGREDPAWRYEDAFVHWEGEPLICAHAWEALAASGGFLLLLWRAICSLNLAAVFGLFGLPASFRIASPGSSSRKSLGRDIARQNAIPADALRLHSSVEWQRLSASFHSCFSSAFQNLAPPVDSPQPSVAALCLPAEGSFAPRLFQWIPGVLPAGKYNRRSGRMTWTLPYCSH